MWLLESLSYLYHELKINISVTVLTRSIPAFLKKAPQFANTAWLNFIEGDVCDFAFPTTQFSHIIHAATQASAQLNREQPITMLDTIALGTRRMLEFAQICGAKSVLLTSSGAVYGQQPYDLSHVPETYLGAPDILSAHSAYGVGKRYAEHLACLFAQEANFEIKIARCFAFVGPYLPLDTHFAIGNFMRSVLNGEVINVLGDGSPFRSYLYAADLVIWLWVILCKGESGCAYNVGSEEAIDIESLAHLVAQCVPNSPEVKIHQARLENLKPARYVPDTQYAKETLGLEQWVSLREAINRTMQWEDGKNGRNKND